MSAKNKRKDNQKLDQPKPYEPFLIESKEAAKLLAISPRKLWELTHDGEVKCLRIGRAVRYYVNDLKEWVENKAK